jgi:Protein kinase domain
MRRQPEPSDDDASVGSLMREVARAPDVSPEELDAALRPGSKVGAYEVIAPIGAGGMGQVYRARDPRLGRDVAVKVLPREFAEHPERRRRFEQEARAAAMVDHPNVVAIHDVGSEGGIPYIVFELLEGETLARRLSRGRLAIGNAIEVAAQIARGLAASHARGVTHRDLKPDNVFLTAGDRVKVIDFGLARPSQPAGRAGETGATVPGTVMGTVGYMSPEQVRGEALDHRTDLFALGAILYEAVSGRRVFDGGSAADVMHAILGLEPPPLTVVAPPTPPALDRIVRRCLAKDRGERYQSAHDLAFQLESVDAAHPAVGLPAVAQSGGQRHWVTWVALAASLVATGLAIAAYVEARKGGDRGALSSEEGVPGDPIGAIAPRAPAAPVAVEASGPGGEDRHWIQSDDYFLGERPWTGGYIQVHLAKLAQAPTGASGERKFFRLDSARDVWTATYWTTRAVRPGELALGMAAICFASNSRDGMYEAPVSKDQARTGAWFMDRVTDTSDASKGWVRVGVQKCSIDAVRVVAP